MLGSIYAVTTVVHDLQAIERAYTEHLGMRVESRGEVDAAQANAWGAPACAGCSTLILLPEIGNATRLRFIEDPAAGTNLPFTTYGWNATEITVRDTDRLAARLANSPFQIIGPPANLKGFETIRAMQVVGPAGECLYLTDVRAEPTLAQATAEIGQVFIVVVAGPEMGGLSSFYRTHFTNDISAPVAVPIGVINTANKLPPDTRHELGLLILPDGTRIELDQYPAGTGPRNTVPGHLPPGMAMVSFRIDRVPAAFAGATCVRGAAGERIEFCVM